MKVKFSVIFKPTNFFPCDTVHNYLYELHKNEKHFYMNYFAKIIQFSSKLFLL